MRIYVSQRHVAALLLCSGLLSLCACAGSSGAQLQSSPAPGVDAGADRLSLHVWEDSLVAPTATEQAEFALTLEQSGATLSAVVEVRQADDLRGVYFDITYNPQQLTPLRAEATGSLAQDSAGGVLELAVLSEPGRLYHGQVLPQWDKATGFSGDTALVRIEFARRPFALRTRATSAAPQSPLSRTTLTFEADALNWGYYNQGDYNQDSLVTINDLTPLGQHFGATVAPSEFPPDSVESVVDGDGNGAINITDITPIGANFNRHVTKYNIYISDTGVEFPAQADEPSQLEPLTTMSYGSHLTQVGQQRLRFHWPLEFHQAGYQCWVRPADSENEGTPSNMVEIPNNPPVAVLSASPESGEIPLSVSFGGFESSDSDGNIVKYEWDFNGDGIYELDSGAESSANEVFDEVGTYVIVLRVTDNLGAQATAQRGIEATEPVINPPGDPVAALVPFPQLGTMPLTVLLDASGSEQEDPPIVSFDWDFDGDGTYELNTAEASTEFVYEEPGTFFPKVRANDSGGGSGEADSVVVVGDGEGFPPDDSVLAIPLDATLTEGQTAFISVYTYRSANPFQFMTGVRMIVPDSLTYVADTYDTGAPGGQQQTIDGLWEQSGASGMLHLPDNFIVPQPQGDGTAAFDINVTPLGASDIAPPSTGAMFNLQFTAAASFVVTFELFDQITRTYYSDGAGTEYEWSDLSNASMPGVTYE